MPPASAARCIRGTNGYIQRKSNLSSISSSILWKYYSGYVTALMMLNWKYGCQNYLLASYEKEIKGIPQFKPEDPSGFRALQYFVLRYETSKATEWNVLLLHDTFCTLVCKLLEDFKNRWNNKAIESVFNNVKLCVRSMLGV